MRKKYPSLSKGNRNILGGLFVLFFSTVLFINGLGIKSFLYLETVFILGFIFFLAFTFFRKVSYPHGWVEYKVFILILVISLFWSLDVGRSIYYLSLFAIGGLIWVIFYNHKKIFSTNLDTAVVVIGLVFLGAYLSSFLKGSIRFDSLSLYLPARLGNSHNHLGDIWAIVSIVIFNRLNSKSRVKLRYFLLLPLAFYTLLISQSRSSYIALLAGILYLVGQRKNFQKGKFIGVIVLIVVLALFMFAGSRKTIFFSRPYFEQATEALIKNPYGYGLGNFGLVSLSQENLLENYSAYTHNLFLEMVSGLGVYALVFMYWFYKVAKDIFAGGDKTQYIYKALFLALTVNFMFDYTYFIPAMLFLWFAFLGLSQGR